MDRPIIYSEEQARSFDFLQGYIDDVEALSELLISALGSASTFASGFSCTATGGMNLNLGAGRLLSWLTIDPAVYGNLPTSTLQAYLSGLFPAQQILLSTASIGQGQAQWVLLEVAYNTLDAIRSGDPTNGVLLYYNVADPDNPKIGPSGNGTAQNTVRKGVSAIKLLYGAVAVAGSAVPPTPDTGYIGLYLILLTYGQTVVTQPSILIAGPGVATGVPNTYPQAPFMNGFLNQHHLGTKGQAPKVVLTNGLEVQGILPFDHLPPFIGGTLAVASRNVFAGPASGSPALPNFRRLVWADLPGAGVEPPATVYAGPVSGPDAIPAFRALQLSDFSGVAIQNVQVFKANGTWTCPAGINMILLSMVAGGAGGTSGTAASYYYYTTGTIPHVVQMLHIQEGSDGAGAGAGGGMHLQPIPVIPGQTYLITVGVGGIQGKSGNNSSFGNLVTVYGGTTVTGGGSAFLFPSGQGPTGNNGGLSLISGYGAGGRGGQGGWITFYNGELSGTGDYPVDAIDTNPQITAPTAGSQGQNGVAIVMW